MKLWKELARALRRCWYKGKVRRSVGHYKEPLRVNGPTKLTRNTFLSNNTHFNGLIVKGPGKVTIGSNFHSGPGCVIMTQNHNHDGEALPYDLTYIVKDVTIGANVWLGEDVRILPGVTIGEGAIIQAGSVVVSDIAPLAIAGGHPCRAFSARDPAKYTRLKREGRYV